MRATTILRNKHLHLTLIQAMKAHWNHALALLCTGRAKALLHMKPLSIQLLLSPQLHNMKRQVNSLYRQGIDAMAANNNQPGVQLPCN